MHQEVISIVPPALVREPRGAELAARVASWLSQGLRGVAAGGRALWHALEEEGRKRAIRELRQRGLSLPAIEAAQVRAMADRHERRDPRFAAELRAAAARHEMLHDVS